jgi:hypothetical protein
MTRGVRFAAVRTRLLAAWLLLALPAGSGVAAGLSLQGVVIDCLSGTRYNLPNVPVYAFDGRKAERLNELVRLADGAASTDDIEVAKRGWADTERLIRFVRTGLRLAVSKTSNAGSFAMEIPGGVGEFILFAYTPSEEGPEFEYAYTRITNKASLTTPVIIAFSG